MYASGFWPHGPMSDDQNQSQMNPPQHQDRQPGIEAEMTPAPVYIKPDYRAAGKLSGKVALVSGGDSGIGRAVAVHFAREGADVAILYLDEHQDAQETLRLIEAEGRRGLTIAGDVGDPAFTERAVAQVVAGLGGLNVLVNNAAEQHPKQEAAEVTPQQVERTFRTNIFGYFNLVRAALPHLKRGDSIVNTTSVTAYRGEPMLLDYSSTKGAIVSYTRSLSQNLVKEGIRVNAVAPGPIWTPLIPATFPAEEVAKFGTDVPMGRVGQPAEVATCFVFLASDDASYLTGQVLHPNGGSVING